MQFINYGGVVPERANLLYFIISMDWFVKWQKYTGCFRTEGDQ